MQLFSSAALLLLTQVSVCRCAPGANLTSNLDRIKIVFTPMVCRRVCSGGRCYNNCEKGDTTTVYSENQHQSPKTQGFRLFFCQIPCLSGGRCIGRDQCWCPSNSTGKFCHLPAPPSARPTLSRKDGSLAGLNSSSHSMYTLPLSNQQVSLHPSLVNVHIQHPHEAEVQIHQVARVKLGQRPPAAEGGHSIQQRSQPGLGNGNGHEHGNSRPHTRQNGYVGRCFQETVDGQCGKPLPGLTKQDDCCGSVGASWGLNKCTECPTKPAYAVIANGQVECPKGYKRVNLTHCQDINECLMNGICKNAECLNTRGSYRCTCKPGYMLDPARSHCVSDKAVSDQRGMCYRSASAGTCSLPLTQHITKQICCCSRVGKAWGTAWGTVWGTACERCPLPDSGTHTHRSYFYHSVYCALFLYHRTAIVVFSLVLCQGKNNVETLNWRPYQRGAVCMGIGLCVCKCRLDPANRRLVLMVFPHLPSPSPVPWPDVDECRDPHSCPSGRCVNAPGSFQCQACGPGFKAARGRCLDVNECLDQSVCFHGRCVNSEGSYSCNCYQGYQASLDNNSCQDVDECLLPGACLHGRCVNLDGSHRCSCNPGYQTTPDSRACEDVDECATPNVCPGGICTNTEGSYSCKNCSPGFQRSADGQRCEDINECEDSGLCLGGQCTNSPGSYSCSCPPGLELVDGTSCRDVNECSKDGVCSHGQCLNTDGSYLCLCEAGFKYSADTADCEDVNECEMSTALCGEALCENVDGSFLCICPSDNEEFDPITSQCRPQGNSTHRDLWDLRVRPIEQRKECYYNLNDANFCDNVLSRNTTKQECCCTVGSGWGDDCEIHPCPVPGREEYNQLCPHGSGLLPQAVSSHSLEQQSFKDVDECKMFGPDICKNGRCSNIFSSYSCFCRTGFYYDNIRLECLDYDECLTEKACVCGVCVNTPGSFNCFCSPSLVLDTTCRHCISVNTTEGDIHLDICWRDMIELYVCIQPLIGWRTTYTECCCLYGVAWSEQCAFCPSRDSDDYALLCNLPRRRGSDSLRERPDHYDGFEGLRAEECGILNGCENGRCVRVREGYTCDCFDGYELDLTKMACIDINECEDISDKVALCKNGACTNTEGSYKCTCLPGFQASAKPHECIPEVPLSGLRESGWKLRV
uniref:Latent-transforming growth factor beta-binding protein 2 n=1 Tax=Oncorhynchus tshawytscha TaxID=74940 RepID=A0AAZ3NNT2_ONCTS